MVIEISKLAGGPAITSFSADLVQIDPGGTTVIAWSTTGADSVRLTGGGVPVGPSGQMQQSPAQTQTYTLTAAGGGTWVSQSVTVVVTRVQILSFSADPPQIALGGTATLSWTITNGATAFIDPGHVPINAASGRLDVSPASSTINTLTAQGAGGAVGMPAAVDVMAPSITEFALQPPALAFGGFVVVTWARRPS
jgi:hypothetical protein